MIRLPSLMRKLIFFKKNISFLFAQPGPSYSDSERPAREPGLSARGANSGTGTPHTARSLALLSARGDRSSEPGAAVGDDAVAAGDDGGGGATVLRMGRFTVTSRLPTRACPPEQHLRRLQMLRILTRDPALLPLLTDPPAPVPLLTAVLAHYTHAHVSHPRPHPFTLDILNALASVFKRVLATPPAAGLVPALPHVPLALLVSHGNSLELVKGGLLALLNLCDSAVGRRAVFAAADADTEDAAGALTDRGDGSGTRRRASSGRAFGSPPPVGPAADGKLMLQGPESASAAPPKLHIDTAAAATAAATSDPFGWGSTAEWLPPALLRAALTLSGHAGALAAQLLAVAVNARTGRGKVIAAGGVGAVLAWLHRARGAEAAPVLAVLAGLCRDRGARAEIRELGGVNVVLRLLNEAASDQGDSGSSSDSDSDSDDNDDDKNNTKNNNNNNENSDIGSQVSGGGDGKQPAAGEGHAADAAGHLVVPASANAEQLSASVASTSSSLSTSSVGSDPPTTVELPPRADARADVAAAVAIVARRASDDALGSDLDALRADAEYLVALLDVIANASIDDENAYQIRCLNGVHDIGQLLVSPRWLAQSARLAADRNSAAQRLSDAEGGGRDALGDGFVLFIFFFDGRRTHTIPPPLYCLFFFFFFFLAVGPPVQAYALRALRFLFSLERNRRLFKRLFPPSLFASFIDVGHYVFEAAAYVGTVAILGALETESPGCVSI
jgi:hypothetical protein